MIKNYTHNNLVWVDLQTPSTEEVREIMERFGVSPLVGEELLAPSLKPKIDLYGHYIYLILQFPAFRHTHSEETNQEVDFIIGRDFLITTHYDTVDPLHKFSKVFEVNSILDRNDIGEHAGFIFYYMVKKLYRSLNHELDFIAGELKIIENRIFAGREKQMLFSLSNVSRELLQFKQSLDLHDEVLHSFEVAAKKFFGGDFEYHSRSIIGAYHRVNAGIHSNIDTLQELRATNDSLLSAKQNETIQTLTFVSILFLPLALIAGIFGISSPFVPLLSGPSGFYGVLVIMGATVLTLFGYFKYKNWL